MKLFEVYKQWPIEPVRAKGLQIWDKDGVEYTDLYGGHAVISIGHSHPHYIRAIEDQLERIGFYSNAVLNSLQSTLAHKLGKISGYNDYSLFLCNSGAEANENALKLASFSTGKSRILAFHKAFHGRTSGAVSATDNPQIRSPFNASDHISFVSLGDTAAIERELSSSQYAGVIIEGIQGVAGIYEPGDDFLRELRRLCSKYGVLLILDEIQSGYGRTGRFFAHQHSGIQADIITTAKGMANGLPIGGVLISPDILARYGMLGTTFGGNHLACAAAIAVLEVIEAENLVENAERVGQYFRNALCNDPAVKEFRGRGLMIGLELHEQFSTLRDRLLFEKHFFTGAAGASVIRLLPALNISESTASDFVHNWRELTSK